MFFILALLLVNVFVSFDLRAIEICEGALSGGNRYSPEKWLENPDWSGESPVPAPLDGRMDITDANHPIPTTIFFSVVQNEGLPKNLRQLVKALRKDQRPLSDDESEMGAIVARYKSGTRRGIRFTSRRKELGLFAIDAADTDRAINTSSIFPDKEIESVALAVHLHTHPDLRNPRFGGKRTLIVPSVDDFEFWIGLREQLRKYHNSPSFHALVIPSGSAVGNIVFQIEDRHLDAYEREKKVRSGLSI